MRGCKVRGDGVELGEGTAPSGIWGVGPVCLPEHVLFHLGPRGAPGQKGGARSCRSKELGCNTRHGDSFVFFCLDFAT